MCLSFCFYRSHFPLKAAIFRDRLFSRLSILSAPSISPVELHARRTMRTCSSVPRYADCLRKNKIDCENLSSLLSITWIHHRIETELSLALSRLPRLFLVPKLEVSTRPTPIQTGSSAAAVQRMS